MTVFVAVGAYFTSLALGLLFAGMLKLRRGKRTLSKMVVIMGVLGVMSLFLFTRPVAGFALVGTFEGRVAILPGNPHQVTKQMRSGKFEGSGGGRFQIRSAAPVEGGWN